MNRSTTILLAALAAALAMAPWLPASAEQAASTVQTLRGAGVDDADEAPAEKAYIGKRPGTQKPIARTFTGQPPLIPHTIEGLPAITLEANACLMCHEIGRNAPKAAPSHFKDLDGKELTQVSPARHQCMSCHVPQADAAPLVQNTFNGALAAEKDDRRAR